MTTVNIPDEAASFKYVKWQTCRLFVLLASFVSFTPAATADCPCSYDKARTAAAATDKPAAESRSADEPGTLRMHAPAARFFRTNGDVRRFKATVGFDPAIYTLKRKWSQTHVAATKMGFKVYADGKIVANAGIMRPDDGTKTIEADVSGARMIALESVDGGFWLGTPQLLALWQDVRFEGNDGLVAVKEDTSGTETPQFGILTPPDDPEPRLNGTWTYGVRPGKPILHRIAATGKAPLALSVVGELPKGLAFDSQSRLLTGSIAELGDHKVVFAASNACGRVTKIGRAHV